MNKIEIEELATATAKWLSKKRQIGLGDVFSESQLTIPVVEHLIPEGWRKFKAERNSVVPIANLVQLAVDRESGNPVVE